ncbi:MAG TPA: short-chain dehydrogenase, partial [Agrobacterium sp.]|uniref:SDR family NAD(P)-dependent oxidoreductase n=1 Tax=Rhizobium sp. TaxID=391 RepID=UPI000ED11AA7|nr:short-chain dehydrogenase [Agrobacterium sp.]
MSKCRSAVKENIPKTVLITGAARRLGRAIATDLAAHGFAIAVHANASMAEAEEFANEIRQKGGKAVAVQADLTQSAPTMALVEQASSALGPIGVVVNNASVFLNDSAEAPDPAVFDAHFAVHVRAPSLIAAAFIE